jgi:hypothetical protein
VDDKNFARTCLYLTSCCTYLPEPEDTQVSVPGSVCVEGHGQHIACFYTAHASTSSCRTCFTERSIVGDGGLCSHDQADLQAQTARQAVCLCVVV